MYFKISVKMNSYALPVRDNNIHHLNKGDKIKYVDRPINNVYRLSKNLKRGISNNRTNNTLRQIERPGGMSNIIVSKEECDGNVIIIETNKNVNDLVNNCANDCVQKGALSSVRQSNTKIANNYFSESNTYYQNRNLIFNKKETNFLDKEESIKLYGKYDKREFYIRNTNTKDYLGNCSVAYFKPSNVHFAVQGAVTASDKIAREKYNNTYFCETIVPLNTFYHGKSKVDTKKIYKKCCPPKEISISREKILDIFDSTKDKLTELKEITGDGDIDVKFDEIEKIDDQEYEVSYIVENINLSELDETEITSMLEFFRREFVSKGLTPSRIIEFEGNDALDVNIHFRSEIFNYYVNMTELEVYYLRNLFEVGRYPIIKNPNYMLKVDNETIFRLILENVEETFLTNQQQQEDFFNYIKNLYFYKFGIPIERIDVRLILE